MSSNTFSIHYVKCQVIILGFYSFKLSEKKPNLSGLNIRNLGDIYTINPEMINIILEYLELNKKMKYQHPIHTISSTK